MGLVSGCQMLRAALVAVCLVSRQERPRYRGERQDDAAAWCLPRTKFFDQSMISVAGTVLRPRKKGAAGQEQVST